jgi:DNA-binding transcriptional ArsR family regulator
MPARKMRVEVFDGSGNRYTITFEGQVTREKALRLLDLVELLGGMPTGNPEWNRTASDLSKFDKVRFVIDRNFPIVWFSSRDVQSAYEEEFKEPISLSTVSTYLSRMVDRGILTKNGVSNRRRYKIMTEVSKVLSFMKGNK